MNQLKVSVFSYPERSKRRSSVIRIFESLIDILDSKYEIDMPVTVEDGHVVYPSFSRFLMKFLDSCKETYGHIDIKWLYCINGMIRNPKDDILPMIESILGPDHRFLKSFILEAQINAEDWKQALGAQFFALQNFPLKPGQGPWGAAQDTYPFSVAIETTGYKESIFHEFLHQFGVSDGYNLTAKSTLKGCEDCWMQWQATKGTNLCKRHRGELRDFLIKMVTKK